MPRTDWYVILHRDVDGGRWVSKTTVTSTRPDSDALVGAIEVYLVVHATKGLAVAVVMEWLARGRPDHMTVTSIWQSEPLRATLESTG